MLFGAWAAWRLVSEWAMQLGPLPVHPGPKSEVFSLFITRWRLDKEVRRALALRSKRAKISPSQNAPE